MKKTPKIDYKKAKNEAQELLNKYFINEPPILADKLAAACGLRVVCVNFSTLGEEYEGISGFIYDKNLYVNTQENPKRQNFTIAHELGHYILGHTEKAGYEMLYRDDRKNNYDSPMEQEANCFAANLLVPEKFLKKVINDYPYATNAQLANIFGVSEIVIRIRKNQLRLI